MSNNLIYSSFSQVKQQLTDTEAIDYFFAKEMVTVLAPPDLTLHAKADFFHLLMALSASLRNGHTCLPISSIANHRLGFQSDEEDIITHNGYIFSGFSELVTLCEQLSLQAGNMQPLVFANNRMYLRRYFTFELELYHFITDRLALQSELSTSSIQSCIKQIFPTVPESSLDEDIDWQKVAVANSLNKQFSVIAGGPGTGKTYTVTKLLAALIMLNNDGNENLTISLVAPTGKAAQRLSESIVNAVEGFKDSISSAVLAEIPREAQTIHRLLGVIPNSTNFRHHQENTLAIDVLLIDEVSMVDVALMTRTFRALPPHCKVILLGDADQLPSVSAGSVLSDIAIRPHLGFSKNNLNYLSTVTGDNLRDKTTNKPSSKQSADHITYLLKSRRFDGAGGIGQIAKAVIAGQSLASWELIANEAQPTEQLTLLAPHDKNWLADLVKRYYQPLFNCTEPSEAFSLFSKFRVLCATRQGDDGVDALNERVKSILQSQGLIYSLTTPYQTLPIMISENDYRLGLYNGDIGFLWKNDEGNLMAVFEGENNQYKWIMPSRLPKHETVYAMTIHKTQGSEFDHVAMVLPKQKENKLLSRELLYTAITRAKSHLSISTTANVWRHAVEAKVERYSGLSLDN